MAAPENSDRPDAVALATAPALPSLKKDNCISNGRYRSVFVAQENIRLYIWKFGENNIGCLTVTVAECISASEFQKKWHSFLNALRKIFPTGMWVRERQPRSGNWHAHAVVNVGWDIKTNFPFDQVRKGFYANVDQQLRAVWKRVREISESHGFGRTELLPLRYHGPGCARYLTKYLSKAFGSDKLFGEEKCKLFSAWGRVRFVHRRFSFLSSRIVQRKKQWLAQVLELPDETHLVSALGTRWWFAIRDSLSQLIMPPEFYMVGSDSNFDFDSIGLRACQVDWPTWPETPSWDLIQRSQFNLFHEVGLLLLGGDSHSAIRFAQNLVLKLARQSMQLELAPARSNGCSKSCNAVPA
jgi:hypothetical protein